MRQYYSTRTTFTWIFGVLCLAACSHQPQGVAVEPKSTLPAGSVVLLDPTTDDAMLPAIGESLSKGAVTIYSLDGASAPVRVQSADPVLSPVAAPTLIGAPSAAPINLREPSNMGGGKDPRVTVFDVDGGTPVMPEPEPEVIAPLPTLPPPISEKIAPLQSPFNKDGQVIAAPKDEVPAGRMVMGTGKRAVSVDNLLETESNPPAAKTAVKKKRPPKGMTY